LQFALPPIPTSGLVGPITEVDALSVGLPLLEISPPVTLPEINLPHSLLQIILIETFVLNPIPFEYLYIVFLNLLLSLSNLLLLEFNAIPMKFAIFELSLISQFLVGIEQLSVSLHLAHMPIANVTLSILVPIITLALSNQITAFSLLKLRSVTQILPDLSSLGFGVPQTVISHHRII
jgi:hypothetical protein